VRRASRSGGREESWEGDRVKVVDSSAKDKLDCFLVADKSCNHYSHPQLACLEKL